MVHWDVKWFFDEVPVGLEAHADEMKALDC